MPLFDIEPDRVNVFHINDQYVFSHYFDRTALFLELQEYYTEEAFRFEIPAEDWARVRSRLNAEEYEPVVIEELEP